MTPGTPSLVNDDRKSLDNQNIENMYIWLSMHHHNKPFSVNSQWAVCMMGFPANDFIVR